METTINGPIGEFHDWLQDAFEPQDADLSGTDATTVLGTDATTVLGADVSPSGAVKEAQPDWEPPEFTEGLHGAGVPLIPLQAKMKRDFLANSVADSLNNKKDYYAQDKSLRNESFDFVNRLPYVALKSDIVLWDTEVYKAASRAQPGVWDGARTIPTDFPERPEIWIMSTPIFYSRTEPAFEESPSMLEAILVLPAETIRKDMDINVKAGGCIVAFFRQMKTNGAESSHLTVRPFNFLRDGGVVESFYRNYIPARRFMQLPFIETPNNELPRHERRRCKNSGQLVPEVRTVVMRKMSDDKQDEKQDDSEAAQAERRHYSCHFINWGGWKAGYERMNPPRPWYQPPHVRGNLDSPFRASREIVTVVNR